MKPLSDQEPKPLLPVLDVPLVAWALGRLAIAGVKVAYVNSNQERARLQSESIRAGGHLGIDTLISHEPGEPLGTAGALRKLKRDLTSTFFVVNADSLTDAPLEGLLETHRSSGALVTLLGVPTEDRADMILDQGWVSQLIDRRISTGAGHLYAGAALFEPEVLKWIPRGPCGLFETVMKEAIARDAGMAVFEWNGYHRDVGSPKDLLEANLEALAGQMTHGDIHKRLGREPLLWEPSAFVGEDSVIGDVQLRHAIIGANVVVPPGTVIERCVVANRARLKKRNYRDSIVIGSRVLKLG